MAGMTLGKERALKAKGFDELFRVGRRKWLEMADTARKYTETYPTRGREVLRPGDVAENLRNAIKIDPDFEDHLAAKRLVQKYWSEFFSEYILEQMFPSNINMETKGR